MKQIVVLLFIFLSVTPVSYADAYKCISDAGETVYRDRECISNEKLEKKIIFEVKTKNDSGLSSDVDENSPLGENLLKNHSFENQLIDWRIPLGAVWTNDGGVNNGGALIIHTDQAPDDKYIHETVVSQCVPLSTGEKFKLSAEFRGLKTPLAAHANRANVIWYESIDCTTGGQWGGFIEPKKHIHIWQKISSNNLTPALGAKSAKITIVQNGRYHNNADAYWDNIVFTPTEMFVQSEQDSSFTIDESSTMPLGNNQVLNGGFDRDISSWRPGWPTEWSGIHGDSLPGSAKVRAQSAYGTIGAGAFSQCVNFGSNTNFEMGASYRSDENSSQKGSGRLRITWYGDENCGGRAKTDTNHADPEDVSGWQKLRISGLQAPPNSASAKIEIIQTVLGKGQHTVHWDDIYISAVE